jgi:FtsP/CotA-like multicopper oxidase with cupredoxin domain
MELFYFGLRLALTFFLILSGSLDRLSTTNSHEAISAINSSLPSNTIQRLFTKRGPFREKGKTVWEYKIVITETEIKLANGNPYKVWAFGGQVPGPTLYAREGDFLRIRLINETAANHTIHSHGLFVPERMDGVPSSHTMAQHDMGSEPLVEPVKPGESFTYEYLARPSGTHFYHCHVDANEHLNRGMVGALIVLPRIPEPHVDQDLAMVLQEWNSRYAKSGKPGNPREVYDCDFFTINGKSFPQTDPIKATIGELIRIRFINAGSQPHSMHLHGHSFLVTHKDGVPLAEPLEMDTVSVGPGERIDILVLANNPGEWPLHCHTAAHQTNAGTYPGGMMTHLLVGDVRFPVTGQGPIIGGLAAIRRTWRRSARLRLGI